MVQLNRQMTSSCRLSACQQAVVSFICSCLAAILNAKFLPCSHQPRAPNYRIIS